MPEHRHRTSRTEERPFTGPATRYHSLNPHAHGCITKVSFCRCGAQREVNVNGLHIELGQWFLPSQEDNA